MEPFEDKKVPDFFANRAQVRSDENVENQENTDEELAFEERDKTVMNDEDSDDVPYDFRAERIGRAFEADAADTEEVDKHFFSVRMHAIGIGVLIGVLVALLVSVFLFGGSEDDNLNDAPIVVEESKRPVKVRPTNPGGMEIPDQDKTIYKRLRTDKVNTDVERIVVSEEAPVRPQVPTREGEILGTPRVMPESSDEMELEVLSLKEKAAMVAEPAKAVEPVKPVSAPIVVEPAPVEKTASAPKAKAAPKVAPKAVAQKDVWRVQLISLPSKAGAEKSWPKILKAHTALLSGLPHDVAEVQIKGKGTFYRLRVGAFKNRNDAKNLCDKLKARKQDCALTK